MQKNALIKSLSGQGFDQKIVAAFASVKREDFIPDEHKEHAYDDIALPIGYGQTISQPYTIAFMLRLLEVESGQKIMEVGSGSGYVLALINELTGGGEIYGVEAVTELVLRSKAVLKSYANIKIFKAAKELGLFRYAPFDRILVSAAATKIPTELLDQLSKNGILVCPIVNDIVKIKKETSGFSQMSYAGFSFVPLIE